MAFQLSPGVLVKETDLTNIIPAVSTSIGGVVIVSEKGPIEEITQISSEKELVDVFGKPDGNTYEYFYTAANFLQYSNTLKVVRANTGNVNACVLEPLFKLKALNIILTTTEVVKQMWVYGLLVLLELTGTIYKFLCVPTQMHILLPQLH